MPHIAINGIEKKDFDIVCPMITEKVSEILDIKPTSVYLEFTQNPLNCCGEPKTDMATAHIWWKRRTANLQKALANNIGEIIKNQSGKKTVKVRFVNLDPSDLHTIE